jgi:hypothetical protein
MKLGHLRKGKIIGCWVCFKVRVLRKMFELKKQKVIEGGENYILKGFIIRTFHHMFL